MARALVYPAADQSRRYDSRYPGVVQSGIDKIVLHSTETAREWGCPGYGGGAAAPTFTLDPWSGRVWQHFPVTMSARALLNPSSTAVSENRDNVCQIEIIGYSDEKIAAKWGSDLRKMGDAEYANIARLVKWISEEHGVPLQTPSSWPEYPSSYGNSSARMSSSQYDRFAGVLAHLHVSGNSHGDVTLDPARLIKACGGVTTPTTASSAPSLRTTWLRKPIAVHGKWSVGTIKRMQAEVNVAIDGIAGPNTWAGIQRWVGATPDGIRGPQTVKALQKKVGMRNLTGRWTPYLVMQVQRHLNALAKARRAAK